MARIRVVVSKEQLPAAGDSGRTQVKVSESAKSGVFYPQVVYGVGSPPENGTFCTGDIFIDVVTGNLFTWN